MSKNRLLPTRGRKFTGIVTSDKMSKTVTVEWERRRYLPKYERYQKRRTKVKAHNPPEINAERGDTVIIEETRPISKTKSFLVTSILKKHAEAAPKEKVAREERKEKEGKDRKKKTEKPE
jgi:small subunit ribosomal protein S17